MKIVIVGTAFPYRGGLATYNERLAREFVKEGHEVEIITFKLQYPAFLYAGNTQFSNESAPTDLKITRRINAVNPFNWMKVGREIKLKSPDKVIFCYWTAFMAPCFAAIARYARSPKTKMIAMVHSMITDEPSPFDRILPSGFVKAMDGFVAMTDSVIDEIIVFDKQNKPKIVSPHPIYDHYGSLMTKKEAAMKLGLHEQKKYVLFFGYIRQFKGLDLLLQAFADERLRQLPIRVIVAGEFYENPQPYLEQIIELKLEGLVELRTGFIPDSEVRNYFSVADIVAQPYRIATQSGVIQIAYHFEKPMLVTNVGCLSDIVPNGKVGYVVDVNPKQIADALVDFFSNQRSEKMIIGLRAEKQRFMWSGMTKAVLSLFDKQ